MVHISYVYPNVSGIAQRGGLSERWRLAKGLGCEYIGLVVVNGKKTTIFGLSTKVK